MIKKIQQHEAAKQDPENLEKRLKDFLTPTGTVTNDSKPPLTALYKDNCKAIDNFNQYLGWIKYPHRVDSASMVLFIDTLRVAACNAWGRSLELNFEDSIGTPEISLKRYLDNLSCSLLLYS